MFQKRGRGDSSSAVYGDRGRSTGRGRGPGRWNTVSERFGILAENEKVPEFVPGSPREESGTASTRSKFSEEQLRAIQHMQKMEEFNRGRVRPSPQYTDASDYRNYHVSNQAINFPTEHDYTRSPEERRQIVLSPEAQEYEKNETHNANLQEVGNRVFYSVMDGDGQGGRKKRKYTSMRQKKQRRRNRRRYSTKKYKK
jgi:hypothetical protein